MNDVFTNFFTKKNRRITAIVTNKVLWLNKAYLAELLNKSYPRLYFCSEAHFINEYDQIPLFIGAILARVCLFVLEVFLFQY